MKKIYFWNCIFVLYYSSKTKIFIILHLDKTFPFHFYALKIFVETQIWCFIIDDALVKVLPEMNFVDIVGYYTFCFWILKQ